jgi:hypothetical protein
VVNGQWIHAGTPIINPSYLTPWNSANSSNSGGASTVYSQVQAQNGSAWNILSTQTHWTMAFIAVSCGATNSAGVTWLGTNYKWTPATVQAVTNDVAAIES